MRFVLTITLKEGQTGPELADDLEHVVRVLRSADWPLTEGQQGYVMRDGTYLPAANGWEIVGPTKRAPLKVGGGLPLGKLNVLIGGKLCPRCRCPEHIGVCNP